MDTQQHTNDLGIAKSSARVLPTNTVCLSRTASVGYVVMMGQPMATSQDFVNWVCSDDINSMYLKYVMLAEGRETFLSFASGTTHQTIYYPEVKAFHVCLPPTSVQEQVVAVLGAIDNLIEINGRRIKLLEQMAQAIYREWFVHFRYPGHEAATLVDSPLGPIPYGWEVRTCGEALTVLGGGTPSKKEPAYWEDGTISWYTPSDLTRSLTRFAGESALKITKDGLRGSSARLFPSGSVLMTSRATLGVLAIASTEASCNQGFIVIPPDPRWPSTFIYEWLDANADELALLGTGATFKEITKGAFKRFPFLLPEADVLTQFQEVTAPIENSVRVLEESVRNLEGLRDLLLPKLVTGQLDVSGLDLDRLMESVA